jgi:hypothetical protein
MSLKIGQSRCVEVEVTKVDFFTFVALVRGIAGETENGKNGDLRKGDV